MALNKRDNSSNIILLTHLMLKGVMQRLCFIEEVGCLYNGPL